MGCVISFALLLGIYIFLLVIIKRVLPISTSEIAYYGGLALMVRYWIWYILFYN